MCAVNTISFHWENLHIKQSMRFSKLISMFMAEVILLKKSILNFFKDLNFRPKNGKKIASVHSNVNFRRENSNTFSISNEGTYFAHNVVK